MARSPSRPFSKPASKTSTNPTSGVVATTPVRNTPLPKTAPAPARKEITREMIAKRAYEISQSGKGGSEMDNWLRAERELRSA